MAAHGLGASSVVGGGGVSAHAVHLSPERRELQAKGGQAGRIIWISSDLPVPGGRRCHTPTHGHAPAERVRVRGAPVGRARGRVRVRV